VVNMSFKELSAWISTLVIGGFGIWYFVKLSANPNDAHVGALVLAAAIGIIFWEVILHVAIAIWHRPERADERDALIGARALRNAYFVLMAGIVTAVWIGLMSNGSLMKPIQIANLEVGGLNILILTIFAAEILNYGSQVFYYRRGG
jgi:hypothetical protein